MGGWCLAERAPAAQPGAVRRSPLSGLGSRKAGRLLEACLARSPPMTVAACGPWAPTGSPRLLLPPPQRPPRAADAPYGKYDAATVIAWFQPGRDGHEIELAARARQTPIPQRSLHGPPLRRGGRRWRRSNRPLSLSSHRVRIRSHNAANAIEIERTRTPIPRAATRAQVPARYRTDWPPNHPPHAGRGGEKSRDAAAKDYLELVASVR